MTTSEVLDCTDFSAIEGVLEQVLSESAAATRERERTAFDRQAGPGPDRIVLFGASHLGRMVLAGLRRAGCPEPLCFADNDPSRWHTSVDGVQVLSPVEAVSRFSESANFVVTIYNGSPVREQLRRMDCRYVIAAHPLLWKYADVFIPDCCIDLPHTLAPQADRIRACYGILGDEQSRRELREQVRWRWSLDYNCLSSPLPGVETYFPPDLLSPLDEEVFVDCGAFDGDSIRAFLAQANNRFRHAYGLEPDPDNRRRLQEYVSGLPIELGGKISVLPYAVGSRSMKIGFQVTSSAASKFATGGETEVECRRLDEVFADGGPTHIKMDIEGAEPDGIQGCAGLFRTSRPAMSVCIYHRNEHLWEIPLPIKSLAPDYSVFIRRYAEDCWEMLCYAVPSERAGLA